jgi:hypothetical protein
MLNKNYRGWKEILAPEKEKFKDFLRKTLSTETHIQSLKFKEQILSVPDESLNIQIKKFAKNSFLVSVTIYQEYEYKSDSWISLDDSLLNIWEEGIASDYLPIEV